MYHTQNGRSGMEGASESPHPVHRVPKRKEDLLKALSAMSLFSDMERQELDMVRARLSLRVACSGVRILIPVIMRSDCGSELCAELCSKTHDLSARRQILPDVRRVRREHHFANNESLWRGGGKGSLFWVLDW